MQVVWHRGELRTHDHPGLATAASSGGRVLPLVVIDPHIFGRSTTTPRRQAWFLENVRALRGAYRDLGGDLVVREGDPCEVLEALIRAHGVEHVHFVANYSAYARERDRAVLAMLDRLGVRATVHPGNYGHEPGSLLTAAGGRYSVYTAYSHAWFATRIPSPLPRPSCLAALPRAVACGKIPSVASDVALPPAGEDAAIERLNRFLEDHEGGYAESRDYPGLACGTSCLGMYFTLGVLSPRLAATRARNVKWRQEVAWRDFHADVLEREPSGGAEEIQPRWRGFPWRRDSSDEVRWTEGRTGFPLVDAGMRELLATGSMHNRVRMVAASFLTKHLLLDWRVGENVFRSLLLCGDSLQNIGNWQWVAGCGCDAAPYFRILNPVAQGERFDPRGEYVRRWLPELEAVPDAVVHKPWRAASLCPKYPSPMIGLPEGRARFLATARAFLGGGAGR